MYNTSISVLELKAHISQKEPGRTHTLTHHKCQKIYHSIHQHVWIIYEYINFIPILTIVRNFLIQVLL